MATLVESEISDFFLGGVIPPPPNVTDIIPGLAGLSSIAGGFDHAVLTHQPEVVYFEDEDDLVSNFSTTISSSTPYATMDPFMMSTHDKLQCGHFTVVEKKLHFTVDVAGECRFWTEGVLSTVVAVFGLLGNLVSIWVLSVPEMRNSFNRLLLALAIIDCMFILPGIVIYTSKAFNWKSEWYNYTFPVFLYPFSEMALCSSIYMTVAIAVERYIGLCRPLQRLTGRGPCSAKVYIFPVLAIALLLNVPKFFESETVLVRTDPLTNATQSKIKVTDLRTDPHYITYYWMWTRLLATGVIPLAVLALLNSKIYLSIRHSKQQLRILAIRSALPMAILGQNAPSVPMSDLMCSENGSPKSSTSHHQNGVAKKTERIGSPRLERQQRVTEQPPINNPSSSSSPLVQQVNGRKSPGELKAARTRQQDCSNGHAKVVASATKSSPSSVIQMNGGSSSSPKPGTPTSVTGRFVNGQFRHIQRSVSAFEPAIKRTLRIKDPNILRSNSTTAATAAGGTAGASGNVIAMTNNWNPGADMKLAPILFGVVIVFVFCNSLRVILNIYDFSVVDSIINCEKKGVGRLPPAWVLCSISISHLLLMVNSSVNFLVYCVAGTRFRRVLFRKLRVLLKSLADALCCRKTKEVPLYDKNNLSSRRRHTVLASNFLDKPAPAALTEVDEEEEDEEKTQLRVRGFTPRLQRRNGSETIF